MEGPCLKNPKIEFPKDILKLILRYRRRLMVLDSIPSETLIDAIVVRFQYIFTSVSDKTQIAECMRNPDLFYQDRINYLKIFFENKGKTYAGVYSSNIFDAILLDISKQHARIQQR